MTFLTPEVAVLHQTKVWFEYIVNPQTSGFDRIQAKGFLSLKGLYLFFHNAYNMQPNSLVEEVGEGFFPFLGNFNELKTLVCNQGGTVFESLSGIYEIGQRVSSKELRQRVDPKSRKSDEVPQNKTIH